MLIEKDEIISKDVEVAETMNEFFSNAVEKLNLKGYHIELLPTCSSDTITNIINKYSRVGGGKVVQRGKVVHLHLLVSQAVKKICIKLSFCM